MLQARLVLHAGNADTHDQLHAAAKANAQMHDQDACTGSA